MDEKKETKHPFKAEADRYLSNVEARSAALRGLADEAETDARLHVRTQKQHWYDHIRSKPKTSMCCGMILAAVLFGVVPMSGPNDFQKRFDALIAAGDKCRANGDYSTAHLNYSDAREVAAEDSDNEAMCAIIMDRWKKLDAARKGVKG